MFSINLWEKNEKIAGAVVYFNDLSATYSGNVYNARGRIIGDFYADNSKDVEKRFPGIFKEK